MTMAKEKNPYEGQRGTCPLCNGTTRRPAIGLMTQREKDSGWYGYDATDDTFNCGNCGWPKGTVPLNRSGEPCVHEWFEQSKLGRCYYRYECRHCGITKDVDSGD